MLDRIFRHRILTHVLYWLSILVIYSIYAMGFGEPVYESFIYKLCFLPGQILATYYLIYFQIPVLIFKRRYFLFILSFILGLYIFPIIAHLADDYLISAILKRDFHKQHSLIEIVSDPILAYYQIIAFLIPFITAAIKIVKQSFEEKQVLEALEQEKADAELQFLKAKIHPHFLFDTLDHLYILSKEKSDLAPEVVVKLSEMLDYMLYQGQAPRVSLNREVDLLQHYLDLEVLQYGEKLIYEFEKRLEFSEAQTVPLILLSVLEFALKNGSAKLENPVRASIYLETNPQHIRFEIIIGGSEKNKTERELSELYKQLELSYADKYKFHVVNNDQQLSYELLLFF